MLYAAAVWWLSTGVILLLVSRSRWTYRWSMAGATLLLIVALGALATSSQRNDPTNAYIAFTSAIAVWGWLEMAFLMGFLTGRRSAPDGGGRSGLRHFLRAVAALLDHELSIIAGAALVVALTWEQPNQIGTWTFLALWGMRQSAKLNLFFGVRNVSIEFLPRELAYLSSYFACGRAGPCERRADAEETLRRVAQGRIGAPALGGRHPRSLLERRAMADVLRMSAFEDRHRIALGVLAEARDASMHVSRRPSRGHAPAPGARRSAAGRRRPSRPRAASHARTARCWRSGCRRRKSARRA